jgi:ubiquinone/menaquinone biosynthesis C-methylase UbiE
MPQSVSFDPVADRYDEAHIIPPYAMPVIARGFLHLAELPPDGTLLEIGIGTGRIGLPLLAEGANVTGVDISARMVERLYAKYEAMRQAEPRHIWGSLATQMTDITALPFPSGTFDAAIAVHVLHLVPEWRRALDEALRVVKPGGAFLLGQEQRDSDDVHHRVQHAWTAIVEDLGYPVAYPGAGYSAIVSEARGRGLRLDEHPLTSWEVTATPLDALRWISERTWSRTWAIPDDVFAESVRRLTAWVEREYNGALDTPHRMSISFTVARIRRK